MENHEKDKIKKIESASSVAKHEQGVTKKDSVADAKRSEIEDCSVSQLSYRTLGTLSEVP